MNPQQLLHWLYQQGATVELQDGDLLVDIADELAESVFTDDVLANLRQHKSAMIALLQSLAVPAATAPMAHDWPASYEIAASLAQERMLFMEELAGNGSYYNIPVAYRIEGELDQAALQHALNHLVACHDVLRTVYAVKDSQYLQQVHVPAALPLHRIDLAAGQAEPELARVLQDEANYRFDLKAEWPIRATLITLAPASHVLSLNIHHIAADGFSARRIIADLGRAYAAKLAGAFGDGEAGQTRRGIQYADYVRWQQEWLGSQRYQETRRYWQQQLAGAPQLHSLITDFTRPNVQTVAGATYSLNAPATLFAAVTAQARASQTTPFVLLQAGFAALLARYSGETDIVFGTAAANRQPAEFADAVGLFVNTLVLRHQVADDASFASLLQQVRSVSDAAFRHQQLPFDALVEDLQPTRSLGYNPLVQIMLVMQEDAASSLTLPATTVVPLAQRQAVSKFDLALHVVNTASGWRFDWEYNLALFKADTIARMAQHFVDLLQQSLAAPDALLAQWLLQPAALDAAPVDPTHFPPAKPAHRQFEACARRLPQSIAVRDGERSLTYHELDARASEVAHALQQQAGGRPGRIGVCMEKSQELVIAMLAIYKAGGVYVPLDPYYPKERLEFMISDAAMQILLCSESLPLPQGLTTQARVLSIESMMGGQMLAESANHTDWPAYIIYTSGSTGKPKGVQISHAALFYSLHTNRELMEIDATDSMPTLGSQAFGVSLLEILLPLISGGSVQIVRKADSADMERLLQVTDQVTVLHAVPSLMRQWLDALLARSHQNHYPNLRLLLVGGEAVPDGLLRKLRQWRSQMRLLELYGMTESTIVCSSFPVESASHAGAAHYCIGKPHPNARFFVLNRHGAPQPLGVPGQLHIGGLSLATEYINQPGMTAEKFIELPWFDGGRLYQTGDRVRLLPDGNHEFLGRVDHQVSLRGARIELGEIEMLATAVDGVKQAVAHVVALGEHEQTLVLYFTLEAGTETDPAPAMRQHLSQHLPDYMRPSLYQKLDAFPLNPNGKVDRRNLPMPMRSTASEAPANELEQRLQAMWCEVLGSKQIGVTDNFFEVGGHSLMVTRLVSKIRAEFGIPFPLTAMFSAPTIRTCAGLLETALKEKLAAQLIHSAPSVDDEQGDELIL